MSLTPMKDFIKQFQGSGVRSLTGYASSTCRGQGRRRCLHFPLAVEPLERRELLSTIQTFNGTGTAFVPQQIGGPPAGTVVTNGGPNGSNSYLLATTPTIAATDNDNSISFVTSDPGTFN